MDGSGRTTDALRHGATPRDAAPSSSCSPPARLADALRDDEDLRAWARPDLQYAWHLAQLHSLLGQTESALEWLDRSVARGFGNHRFLREHERIFDPLRDDPLFEALVGRAEAEQDELRRAVGTLEV